MESFSIGNIEVEVVKKNIKNIHLAVYPPNGKVRLAAPAEVNDETLRLFTISKLVWIKRQQKKFNLQDRQTERKYVNRETHYFLGKKYLLKVIEDCKFAKVGVTKNTIVLSVKPAATQLQKQSLINEWYRAELKKLVPAIVDKWEKQMGVQVEEWGVKQMKTKWGTCNIKAKRIWLNLELAKKPVKCLDYIIAHEMIHLLERHHNDLFLAYMNKFVPNWKQIKNELNKLPVSHADWEY